MKHASEGSNLALNPGHMSPEVQPRGISDLPNWTSARQKTQKTGVLLMKNEDSQGTVVIFLSRICNLYRKYIVSQLLCDSSLG